MEKIELAKKFLDLLNQKKPINLINYFNVGFKGAFVILKNIENSKTFVTAGELANRLDVSTARMATALNALCKHGFVIREKSSQDARKTIVKLTEQGHMAVKKQQEEIIKRTANFLDRLSENEVKVLFNIIGSFV